jgi:exodeoxyribonuclease VII large subunit
MDETQIFSVADITKMIKNKIERTPEFSNVWIRGEISNFTLHSRGHMYFSLKDDQAVLRAVMFANSNKTLSFQPKNGLKILVRGDLSVYEASGNYQMMIKEMIPEGLGSLYLAYEQLKQRLEAEGLFSPRLKKPVPLYPTVIGVITSPTGAVIRDIATTLRRRYPFAQVLLMPVVVQGEYAPGSIITAIEQMNKRNDVNVIILARGGGSLEDLWAFNEEKVARAIVASHIPIISAIGHETDTTIADFVSDLRAPTPTAAAEMVAPHFAELKTQVDASLQKAKKHVAQLLNQQNQRFISLKKHLSFYHPQKLLDSSNQKLDQKMVRLQHVFTQKLNVKKNQFQIQLTKLEGLSPLKVMQRGYAAVQKDGQLIRSVQELSENDRIEMRLLDGKAICLIEKLEELA